MTDDFRKYEAMRDEGTDPNQVYLAAKADGLDPITLLRLLRAVFALSLTEAKEVKVVTEGWAQSLDQFQEQLVPAVEQAMAEAAETHSVNGIGRESRVRAGADE